MSHSDKWDKYERKLDASDMKEDEEPEKEKVDVVTEEKEQEQPFSGLYCYCKDVATFVFHGNSLCLKHFDDEMAKVIKHYEKCDKHK